jgi:hypothetical protein
MERVDIDQKPTTRVGRAAEKPKAEQLTEPRRGTEWLDQFSIDPPAPAAGSVLQRMQRLAQEKRKRKRKRAAEEKKRVAEEKKKREAQEKKEEKQRAAEEKSKTNPRTVIPGESTQQREERIARWIAVEEHIHAASKSEEELRKSREATSRRTDRKR